MYQEPESNVAKAFQYPITDPLWIERMIGAYYQDAAKKREEIRELRRVHGGSLDDWQYGWHKNKDPLEARKRS